MQLSPEKLQRYLKAKNNPGLSVLDLIDRAEKMALDIVKSTVDAKTASLTDELRVEISQAIHDYIANKVTEIKGINGKTPIKGTDYFTQAEISDLLQKATPVKGVHYVDGEDGEDGEDGDTPTDEELIRLITPLIPEPKHGIDGSPDTPEQIAAKINTLNGVIEQKTIKGFDNLVKNLQSAFRESTTKKSKLNHGGGISSIIAGSGITITNNGHQSFTITSTGGSGGGGFTTWDPTETPDGNLTVFTYTLATAQPTFIISGGVWLKATSKSGTINWTWNAGSLQATFTVPPTDDAIAVK